MVCVDKLAKLWANKMTLNSERDVKQIKHSTAYRSNGDQARKPVPIIESCKTNTFTSQVNCDGQQKENGRAKKIRICWLYRCARILWWLKKFSSYLNGNWCVWCVFIYTNRIFLISLSVCPAFQPSKIVNYLYKTLALHFVHHYRHVVCFAYEFSMWQRQSALRLVFVYKQLLQRVSQQWTCDFVSITTLLNLTFIDTCDRWTLLSPHDARNEISKKALCFQLSNGNKSSLPICSRIQ